MSNLKLLFHDVTESIAVIATIGSFVLVWRSRRFLNNNYLFIIGIALFFVGLLEISHMVSNHITVALGNYNHNLHIQLYVASRYLLNTSLLIAPLFIGKKIGFFKLFVVYSCAATLFIGSIFIWKIFPDCYVESSGLTNFEAHSEYIVSQMLVISVGLLFWKYSFFDRPVLLLLGAALVSSISSEVSFAQYMGETIFPNIAGHIFLTVSYCLTFMAIFVAKRLSSDRRCQSCEVSSPVN